MARIPYVLPELADKHGELETAIPDIVNKLDGNLHSAAKYLNVSPATLSRWLKEKGYTRRVIWEKTV